MKNRVGGKKSGDPPQKKPHPPPSEALIRAEGPRQGEGRGVGGGGGPEELGAVAGPRRRRVRPASPLFAFENDSIQDP